MGIGFITILFIVSLISFNFYFSSRFRFITTNYYFYAGLSIFFLTWFIAFRWADDLSDLISGTYPYGFSVAMSKAFLLDLCPFLGFFLPISLILDKSRNSAKVLALFGIVGPGITLFGQVMFETLDHNTSGTTISIVEYIFFNKLYYFMHAYVFVLSFLVLQNSKNFSWKSLANTHIFIACYFAYVLIFVFGFGVDKNVTGLAPYDWSMWGQYHTISVIFKLKWPLIPIATYLLVWVWVVLMIIIKNVANKYEGNKHEKEIPIEKFFGT